MRLHFSGYGDLEGSREQSSSLGLWKVWFPLGTLYQWYA